MTVTITNQGNPVNIAADSQTISVNVTSYDTSAAAAESAADALLDADRAEAAALTIPLYRQAFTDLAAITPAQLAIGSDVETPIGRYRRVSTGGDLDYSGTGGVRLTVLQGTSGFDVRAFGATGDGTTDDTTAIQACLNRAVAINGKVIFPQANYYVTSPLLVTAPISLDGQMSNVYQATVDTDLFIFDEGSPGASNFQNGWDIRNLLVRTAVGSVGDAFIFRNINESTFENLFVVGCSGAAYRIEGSLLSKWTHCYVGNGLTASPGFYRAGASGSENGFQLVTLNGLAPNTNIFDRCSATNCRTYAFDIIGTGNTILNFDAEGITLPAIAMNVNGLSTNIIGGNFEGTGGNVEVGASNCTIQGANILGALNIKSGVTGTNVIGGNVKQFAFSAGSYNNSAVGTRIGTGGFLVDNGTNNLKLNIYNSVTSAEVGMYQSGAFAPDLKFGGVSGVSAYFQQKGSWWRFGDLVHFNLWLQVNTLSAATGAATIDLGNIPYTPAGTVNIPCAWSGNGVPVGTGYGNVAPIIDAGTKTILLQKSLATTGVVANLTNADFTSGDQIQISGFFPMTLNA